MRKRAKWAVIAASLATLSSVAWAYTSAPSSIVVQAHTRSTLPSGRMTQVTALNQSVTLPDNTHVTQGISLFKVDVGDPTQSNQIHVYFTWMDPQDDAGVLHNGWVSVGLYYPTTATDPDAVTFTLPGTSQLMYVKLDPTTQWMLNASDTNVMMSPTVTGVSTYYVLVSILNHAGNNSSGQQGVASALLFNCTAR